MMLWHGLVVTSLITSTKFLYVEQGKYWHGWSFAGITFCWWPYLIFTIIFGRPFVKRFALCYRTVVCPLCLSVCHVGVLWPHGWMDQDATWYGGRPQSKRHCVRWGPDAPKIGTAPNFLFMSVVAKRLDGSRCHFGTEVDLGPGHIVLDRDPALPRKGHSSPPLFGQCLLWPNGRPSQLLLSSCSYFYLN